ncbi:hypothetical protein CPB86DRAFT_262054 [Serendipita vermifera]|nr:hypothetical protein CPB86DRAFT_262054 [Serendipita vermifera]
MPAVMNLSPSDKVIIILGETGAGKTHFINVAARRNNIGVGTSLADCTKDIDLVQIRHPTQHHNIVLVDTPGFNATYRSDGDTLNIITSWLQTTHKRKIQLAGVIYLFRISDNRLGKTALAYLHIVGNLCGEEAKKNVSVLTTMWDHVKEADGTRREQELENNFCKEILEGCGVERFRNSHDSAWKIIDKLLEKQPCPTLPAQLGPTGAGSRTAAQETLHHLQQDKKKSRKIFEKLFPCQTYRYLNR